MKRGPFRWALRLAILPVFGIGLLIWANREKTPNLLTVENRSEQTIAVLKVTASGQTKNLGQVAAGAEVKAPQPLQEDEAFVVEGKLADGTIIRHSGMCGERPRLVVLPGGHIIVRPSAKN
jgi:hypothetical protein